MAADGVRMGRELDSLADVISFGVAPAVIGYGCGMQGLYDRIVLRTSLPAEYPAWRATTLPPRRLSEAGAR